MPGLIGDKGLHPAAVYVGDTQLRTRGGVFHADDDPHIVGVFVQVGAEGGVSPE
jgi:hypothetical protein